MNSPLAAIELEGVTKGYARKGKAALKNISMRVEAGDRLGIVGANGSGKTTLMRIIMNFIKADSGIVKVLGSTDLERQRASIGFIPERQQGMENFTPRELLTTAARMFSLSPTETAERTEELLKFANIEDAADNLLSSFSKGMAQRVQICLAILHRPPILLLDEAMSGLDPGGQKTVRDLLLKLDNQTLLYASHNLEEIETFCDQVIILHEGEIAEQLSLKELQQEVHQFEVAVAARELLEMHLNGAFDIQKEENGQIRVRFSGTSATLHTTLNALSNDGYTVSRLRSKSVLEDIYHRTSANVGVT